MLLLGTCLADSHDCKMRRLQLDIKLAWVCRGSCAGATLPSQVALLLTLQHHRSITMAKAGFACPPALPSPCSSVAETLLRVSRWRAVEVRIGVREWPRLRAQFLLTGSSRQDPKFKRRAPSRQPICGRPLLQCHLPPRQGRSPWPWASRCTSRRSRALTRSGLTLFFSRARLDPTSSRRRSAAAQDQKFCWPSPRRSSVGSASQLLAAWDFEPLLHGSRGIDDSSHGRVCLMGQTSSLDHGAVLLEVVTKNTLLLVGLWPCGACR